MTASYLSELAQKRRTIEEVVHLEALGMFTDIFWKPSFDEDPPEVDPTGRRGPTRESMSTVRDRLRTAPAGDPSGDIFALVEHDRAVVWWTRGGADRAIFPCIRDPNGHPSLPKPYPATQAFLGVPIIPGAVVPPEVVATLSELERSRGAEWRGGAVKVYREVVYKRRVYV